MRKFSLDIDPASAYIFLRQVDTDEEFNEQIPLHELQNNDYTDLSKEDLQRLLVINNFLSDKNKPMLTVDEALFLCGITNASKQFDKKVQTKEDLQRLAGFSVTKNITYHDDTKK